MLNHHWLGLRQSGYAAPVVNTKETCYQHKRDLHWTLASPLSRPNLNVTNTKDTFSARRGAGQLECGLSASRVRSLDIAERGNGIAGGAACGEGDEGRAGADALDAASQL